eukprot:463660_1
MPNVSNLCNLFKNCDHIIIVMPKTLVNINTNNFCESVIEDTFNISNKNVAVEFKWPSKPITFAIETKFKEYAKKYSTLNLETYILQDTSTIILPSAINVIDKQLLSESINRVNDGFMKLKKIARQDKSLVNGYVREHELQLFSNQHRGNVYYSLHSVAFVILIYFASILSPEQIKKVKLFANHAIKIYQMANEAHFTRVKERLNKLGIEKLLSNNSVYVKSTAEKTYANIRNKMTENDEKLDDDNSSISSTSMDSHPLPRLVKRDAIHGREANVKLRQTSPGEFCKWVLSCVKFHVSSKTVKIIINISMEKRINGSQLLKYLNKNSNSNQTDQLKDFIQDVLECNEIYLLDYLTSTIINDHKNNKIPFEKYKPKQFADYIQTQSHLFIANTLTNKPVDVDFYCTKNDKFLLTLLRQKCGFRHNLATSLISRIDNYPQQPLEMIHSDDNDVFSDASETNVKCIGPYFEYVYDEIPYMEDIHDINIMHVATHFSTNLNQHYFKKQAKLVYKIDCDSFYDVLYDDIVRQSLGFHKSKAKNWIINYELLKIWETIVACQITRKKFNEIFGDTYLSFLPKKRREMLCKKLNIDIAKGKLNHL